MWVNNHHHHHTPSPSPCAPCAKRHKTHHRSDAVVDPMLRIRQLEERRSKLTARWQARQRKDMDEQIASLRQEMSAPPESMDHNTLQEEKKTASADTSPPPGKAAQPPPAAPADGNVTQVRTVRNGKEVTVYLADNDECHHCRKQMVMIPGAALLSCTECGRSKPYLDATSASTAYGEEVEFSNFSYKRSNHFQEWLNSFQAKETTEIPKDVFRRVMEELYRQRISDLNQITRKKVREVLKDLKLRKYYEHVTQITCRLNGKRPPRMTPDQEEQCRLMFMAIQGPFEKNCPPDRKNFLSYSYCLYKFCELMAYDEFLPCFSLLKGRDKLFKQDMIFKKICEDLGWSWLPSI